MDYTLRDLIACTQLLIDKLFYGCQLKFVMLIAFIYNTRLFV